MSYNLLKGKRGIIFGALNEQSIAWKVAEKAVEEGATITLSNTPVAVRMGEVSALAEKLNCEVIAADATSVEDLENVFKRSMEVLGGQVDFVLHSIGMSPNVRKKRTYDNLDYDMLDKTLDISAVSFHKMIQAAKKMNAIAEYGSILALSYVAAQRTFYGYNDMADAKALLESIARSFGYIYGREHNVRVNTISQSPTMTTAGSGVKGMDKLFDFANRMSPLGNASADECADYCIVMFSDLTRKVTMQNLFHDGGFSSVGMSLRAMATYEKGLDEYKDENGKIVIPCIYESVTTFNCSIALVLKNNEWRLIDEEGNLIPKSKYDYVEEYRDGYSRVLRNKHWGFTDMEGKEVIPCRYDYV